MRASCVGMRRKKIRCAMGKIKQIFKNTRVIILLIVIALAIFAISPQLDAHGVAIRQVVKGSAASLAGIESPAPGAAPTNRELITIVNGEPIRDDIQYYSVVNNLPPDQVLTIQTNENTYRLRTVPITRVDNETNETIVLGTEDIGLVVYNAPQNNIQKGLDLAGGTRVIMQPETRVSPEDLDLIIDNIKERLNVFGLSDIIVRSAKDLMYNDFIIVEIAGANKDEVRDLLGNQGKFEARIANETVFSGGDDITFVCRSPECSGIDTRSGGCQPTSDGTWTCRFSFSISLSEAAAKRQAAITDALTIQSDEGGAYLSQPLDLFLDDELVDTLQIAADLKGRAVMDIQISGSGAGADEQSALEEALGNMRTLQTVLITGSLPVKLEIVKTDGISPVLGQEFVNNAIIMGLAAIFAVAAVIFIRYRKLAISIPVVITMLSETVIILGFAALFRWQLDLAAIAGIIIAVGTGVDDQIVIIDETLRGEDLARTWKQRLKSAFFIIFGAFATTVFAMVPLLFAGAGLLRGFALTTIAGVAIGVLIARPAFAAVIEILLKDVA